MGGKKDLSTSLDELWRYNQDSPEQLIKKLSHCFKGMVSDNVFYISKKLTESRQHRAARSTLIFYLKKSTPQARKIATRRLQLILILDEHINQQKANRKKPLVIEEILLAERESLNAAKSLLLDVIKPNSEKYLHFESLKNIYPSLKKKRKKIHSRLLTVRHSPPLAQELIENIANQYTSLTN